MKHSSSFWEAHSESSCGESSEEESNTPKNKIKFDVESNTPRNKMKFDEESNTDSDTDSNIPTKQIRGDEFKKPITFDELKKKLNRYEPSIIHTYSSALDILASFIKSQAFIYNEAGNFCRFRLNLLMFPCIFLSSLCSVFANTTNQIPNGMLYLSGINAFISFLLAIVNFLKLDAHAEAHQISSNHYSKLRTILEFSSGEVLLFSNPLLQLNGIEKEMDNWAHINKLRSRDTDSNEATENILDNYHKSQQQKLSLLYKEREQLEKHMISMLQDKISVIKQKVIEIRESNRFSVPKYITNRYLVIYNINIFSFIKTVSDYKNGSISTLKNINNEIRYITNKPEMNKGDQQTIKKLYGEKIEIMKELFALSSTHNLIDIMFQQEIKNNILFKNYYYLFYAQQFINLICCGNYTSLLPVGYKNPYDCGFYDKKQDKSLLRKVLNT